MCPNVGFLTRNLAGLFSPGVLVSYRVIVHKPSTAHDERNQVYSARETVTHTVSLYAQGSVYFVCVVVRTKRKKIENVVLLPIDGGFGWFPPLVGPGYLY